MKQRSIQIAFYACKINIELEFMEACYNIKDVVKNLILLQIFHIAQIILDSQMHVKIKSILKY